MKHVTFHKSYGPSLSPKNEVVQIPPDVLQSESKKLMEKLVNLQEQMMRQMLGAHIPFDTGNPDEISFAE